jgi:diketogulonate reductase-like aldo/keto reductase
LYNFSCSPITNYFVVQNRCIEELSWMNCEESKIPGSSWQESWRALEKEYAEGRVLSIGVSNFALDELKDLVAFSSVKPHVVQNYVQPGKVDFAMLEYCEAENIRFMAYSTLQYRDQLSPELTSSIQEIADLHWRTPEAIVLRSFVQSGIVVVPRSENVVHLLGNQQSFNWELTNSQMKTLGW